MSSYDWFLCCVSAMVSYNVIIGDTITKIILWMGGDSEYIAQQSLSRHRAPVAY